MHNNWWYIHTAQTSVATTFSKDVDTKPLSSERWLWDRPKVDRMDNGDAPQSQTEKHKLARCEVGQMVSIVSQSLRFLGLILSYNPGHGKVIPAIYGLYHDATGWIFPLRWLKHNEPAKLNGGLLPGKSSTDGGHASNHYFSSSGFPIWINHLLPSCVGANFAFRRVRAFFVRTPTGPSAASGSLQGTMGTWRTGLGSTSLAPKTMVM